MGSGGMRRALAGAGSMACLALLAAAPGTAGVVDRQHTMMRYLGDPEGETVTVSPVSGSTYRLTEPGGVTAGAGCVAIDATTAECAGVLNIVVRGYGGDDRVTIDPQITAVTHLYGDAGSDVLTGGSGRDLLWGDLSDYGAHDDTLIGGAGDDYLADWGGSDRLEGGPGADELVLNGQDALPDVLLGGEGDDLVKSVWTRSADTVDCGAGTDVADVDGLDTLTDCERVAPRTRDTPRFLPSGNHPGLRFEGETLTYDLGTWTGTEPITFSYQWRRCTTVDYSSCVLVPEVTGPSYPLGAADVDTVIRVAWEVRNEVGYRLGQELIGIIAPAAPLFVASPTISGVPVAGETLTATPVEWKPTRYPSSEVARAWYTCEPDGNSCRKIAGATGLTYVVARNDEGRALRFGATATNERGSTVAFSDHVVVLDRTRPACQFRSITSRKIKPALARGIRAVLSCSEATDAIVTVAISRALARKLRIPVTVARAKASLNRSERIVAPFTRAARRKLGGLRSVSLVVTLDSVDAAANRSSLKRRLVLRR